MAQTTVLAAATAAGTSTDIVVAAGASVCVGLFVASGGVEVSGPVAELWADTPGADIPVATLSVDNPLEVISGPGTFRVKKIATAQAIGIYTET